VICTQVAMILLRSVVQRTQQHKHFSVMYLFDKVFSSFEDNSC